MITKKREEVEDEGAEPKEYKYRKDYMGGPIH